jgi:hypothetical protein
MDDGRWTMDDEGGVEGLRGWVIEATLAGKPPVAHGLLRLGFDVIPRLRGTWLQSNCLAGFLVVPPRNDGRSASWK